MPYAQCAYVRLGGHGQTGGYGQLGRSFGLLGDHIWGIRMIDSDGKIQEVTKASNKELFYAILGVSPGNFGIITHYTIQVYRDADHNFPGGLGPHGFKGVWLYNEKVVKLLLNEVAAMADDQEFPRNFDLCVSVLSRSFKLSKLIPEWEDDQKQIDKHKEEIPGDAIDASIQYVPGVVMLYAQWVPMNADDKYTDKVDAWFNKFRDLKHLRDLCLYSKEFCEPMFVMTGYWIFRGYREFDHTYDKRTYMTNSRTLVRDKWVDQVADQIHQVLTPLGGRPDLWKNCFLSCQFQCFGGKYSQYYANRNNGTAYSWRDSTVCQTLDCFYKEGEKGKALAKGWQDANNKLMCGENSRFSKQDKRVLWGSYDAIGIWTRSGRSTSRIEPSMRGLEGKGTRPIVMELLLLILSMSKS